MTVTVLDVDEVLTVSNFDMTDATDTGSSQSDEYTSNGLPVLTFSGEPNLTLTLKGPDNTVLTQGTHYSVTYSGGVYTVTLLDAVTGGTANPFGTYSGGAATGNPAATADGTYTISATDAAGNSGTVGTFEINTAPPSKTTTISQMDKDTGTSTDFITTDGSATRSVTGTISAALGTNEIVQVSFDNGATWSTATTTSTNWTINDPTVHSGNWVIKSRVLNSLNGVAGTAASQAVVLEGAAPSVTGGGTGGGGGGGDATPPLITGPSGPEGSSDSTKSIPENTRPVAVFTANEPVNWSISGGLDSSLFSLDAVTGALTFNVAPDFERPGDSGGDNVYQLTVAATDLSGNVSTQTVSVIVTDIDEAHPIITGPSNGPGAAQSAKSIPENTLPVTTLTANEAVRWTISGGPDAGLFLLDPATGALSLKAAPDFEWPQDVGADNVYNLTVTAIDTVGLSSAQSIAVTVENVLEYKAIYTAPIKTGDQVLYTTQADALNKAGADGTSVRIDFYGTTEASSNSVPLKAWQNLITGDVFYAPADKLPPYDCYVELTNVSLPQVFKVGTGAFDVHLYVNAAGITQMVGEETARSLNLVGQGYSDLGAIFASAAPLNLAAITSQTTFG